MDARHPATHRPPPPPTTDSRSARPPHAGHAHFVSQQHRSTSPSLSDAEQDVMAAPRHVPARPLPGDERTQPTPYRVPTPPYQHTRRPQLQNDSEDEERPFNPAHSRDSQAVDPARQEPSDDSRAGHHKRGRSPKRSHTFDTALAQASRLEGGSGSTSRRALSDDEGDSHRTERRGEPARVLPAGEVVWSRNMTEILGSRAPSGTSTVSQHRLPTSPFDEPFTPLVPPPGAMYPQPNPELPVYNFNRERYPAYDVHARRIGLEHTRFETTPAQPGSYYRPRTRFYPSADTSASEYPHVMSIELDTQATATSAPRPAKAPDPKAPQPPGPPPVIAPEPSTSHPLRPVRRLRTPPPPVEEDPVARDTPSPPPVATTEAAPEAEAEAEVADEETAAGPAVNTTPYLRDMLGLGPDEEVSLRALADPVPGEKPNYPYPTLIKLAIHGSINKRLTLQEIYLALEDRFQWYKDNADDKSWQNSIRHNLSLNKCFRRVARPITEPGKGSFWVVDYSQGTGNKRERKRNKKPTKAQLRRLAAEEAARAAAAVTREENSLPTPTLDAAPPTTGILQLPPLSDLGHSGRPRDPVRQGSEGGNSSTMSPIGPSPTVECAFSSIPPPPRPDSRSSRGTPIIAARMDDAHIDPQLRDPGHVVGEGRSRSGPGPPRRPSSPYLPPVQIRQSARISARQNTVYDGHRTRSPSPHASSSSSIPGPGPFPRRGYSQTSPTTYDSPAAHSRAPVRSQPAFGQASLGVSTQYTVPAPSTWAPYAPPVPSPQTHHRPLNAVPPPSNALMLAGVPNNPPGTSSAYIQAPAPSSSSTARSARAPSTSSGREYNDRGEGPSRRRRSGSRRKVYTDSRGNVYPVQGRSADSSSGSSPE